MANESYSDRNRNRLFEIVRDGSYAEAKKVLSEAHMTWRHTALRQNFLFFIAARRRRGSEMLAKQCVGMGVNLEEVDVYGQTPLFWAAARGNMVVVNFLLQLGFEVNYRDYARKTALFFAIENGHLDVADFLIERAASIQVRSKEQKTPQTMLKALNHKGKRESGRHQRRVAYALALQLGAVLRSGNGPKRSRSRLLNEARTMCSWRTSSISVDKLVWTSNFNRYANPPRPCPSRNLRLEHQPSETSYD